ncbi:MAG TPA: hypothetical protein VGM60_21225 [Pseudonocardia sp.]|uniref:hypothetical protein n=1 Tax=Pseudonocardia sp. TaxID=60912 RepID=UPI002F3FE7EE
MGAHRVLSAAQLAATVVLLAGCGSSALTNQPSSMPGNSAPAAAPTISPTGALAGAVTKLRLISQDSCQTAPPERIYTACDRFLAELRSAVGTLSDGASSLPNSAGVRTASAVVAGGAQSFDQDGCGSGPYAAGPTAAPRCAADLGRIRQGVNDLLALTGGQPGG